MTEAADKTTIAELALFLHRLADETDAIARRYFRQPLLVDTKTDTSPVTIADQEIEMAMVELIRRHYPDHGIFGEESQRILPDAAWQWVIDPIDGTRAFIAGKPTFTTLIAICHQQIPMLGLMSQPIQQRRWLGGDQTTPDKPDDDLPDALADCCISTTSLTYFNAAQTKSYRQLESACHHTLLNHDGLAYGMLTDGSVDIALDAALKPYDFCALAPIVAQAGGSITDWDGKPLTLTSNGTVLAARSASLHQKAMDLLNNPTI